MAKLMTIYYWEEPSGGKATNPLKGSVQLLYRKQKHK